VFLGNNYQDTLSIIRIENFLDDPKIIALKKETDKVFPSLDQVENNLTKAFRYVNYYVPDFNLPKVYSYISGLYYESPVEYHDSVLIIALDLFLGSKYEPYRAIGLPRYMTRRMTPDFLLPSCIKQIGISLLPEHLPQKTLLDQMMLHGKVLYFLDKVLPDLPDTLISGFTQAQEEWIHDNEGKVWALLIDDELLYSTDTFIINKFIQDGPFTSGLSEKSPAMLGRWIGWHIIRSYMNDHSGITMQELFKMADSQDLLSKSHYKPPRT
jgi:hypothetical protein